MQEWLRFRIILTYCFRPKALGGLWVAATATTSALASATTTAAGLLVGVSAAKKILHKKRSTYCVNVYGESCSLIVKTMSRARLRSCFASVVTYSLSGL